MNIYNEAIKLLKQQDFLKAEQLLLHVLKEQQVDEVIWSLGLVQIYLGKPYQALSYWQQIQNPVHYEIEKQSAKVQALLPRYDRLYTKYNEAVALLNNKEFDAAFMLFTECLQFKDALPIEIYEGYMNLAYYLEKDSLVDAMIKHAPKHVLSSTKIHYTHVLKQYTEQLQGENNQLQNKEIIYNKEIRSTRKQRNGFIGGTVALAAALIATIVIINAVDQPDISVATTVESSEDNVDTVAQSVNEDMKQQFEQKIALLEQQLAENTASMEKLNEKEMLLQQKDISLDTLLADAQKKQYQTGYYYYKNGQYEAAQDFLEKSLQFEQDVYYADDAHYFLIQTKKNLGDDDLGADYEYFITNEFESYQQSPFFDDILLQYAHYEMSNQSNEQAKQLFKRIVDDYSGEWTASSATKLLNELAEL